MWRLDAALNILTQRIPQLCGCVHKSKASKLAEHRPYDLKITLDKGISPPFAPIYSLSQEELTALHKFIDKDLATRFICPSCSSLGAPVIFICKKDSSLRPCVNFR